MNINKVSNSNTNFKAIKVATLKNKVLEGSNNIDIYQIRCEDQTWKKNTHYRFRKLSVHFR